MSQVVFESIVPSVTSGNELALILNDFKDAIISGFSGTTRPSEIDPGGYWIDTTNNPTSWDYKLFTGVSDILVFRVNLTTGAASFAGADSMFEVTKISDDAVGPLVRLTKKRVAGGGQTLENDILGEIQFFGTRDNSAIIEQANIQAVSTDNVTGVTAGSYLKFEVINDAASTLIEVMRLINSRVGIGTGAPEEKLHVVGNIKAESIADNAFGPELLIAKKRLTTGVLEDDAIGAVSFKSKEGTGSTEIEVARLEAMATEDHTDLAQGTKLSLKYKKTGEAVFTEALSVDSAGVNIENLNVTNLVATNTELGTVVETADAKLVVNKGGTLAMANAAPAGLEVEITDGTNAAIAYDSTLTSKWKVGEVGTLKEVVTVSDMQTLTQKVLDGADVRTPVRLDVKQGLEAALITYALTATNGQLCFATDTKVMYQVVDTELVPLGAGGGGVSLNWRGLTNAPVNSFDFGLDLYEFDNISNNEIYATLTVPQSYRAGKPIKLVGGSYFCSSTTGNVFFRTQATLINNGVILGTFTNNRTSTNTQTTVPGVANTIASIGELDLTSLIGEINGIAVLPGNKIRIRLYRDNANESVPASEPAKLLIDGLEPTFS